MPDSPGSDLVIRLGDLDNVDRGAPEDGDTLVFNGETETWMPAAPAGGGVTDIWVDGSQFGGSFSGFGSPGGSGEMAAASFGAGQNTYGITDVVIPSDWDAFTVAIYVHAASASGPYHFECNWQLADAGDALDGDLNATESEFPNLGSGFLTIGDPIDIENPDSKPLLQFKIRSNNATQGVAAEIHLLGIRLQKV